MMLVYSPKITSRLRYILDLMLGDLLGVAFELTSDPEAYLNFKGAVINYSPSSLKPGELWIFPSGFLEKRGIQALKPDVKYINGLPSLFPSKEGDTLGFDPFSASFYLISRYEEYLPFRKDEHGRFEASQSFAFKNGFLDKPMVNIYAAVLKTGLLKSFPFLEFNEPSYCLLPTYDVDAAYGYIGKGVMRTLGGMIKSLVSGDYKAIANRWKVIAGKRKDPLDTYDLQLEIHRAYGLKAFYFFLCGDYGPHDRNITYFSIAFQNW
jgi:hypothetical protein